MGTNRKNTTRTLQKNLKRNIYLCAKRFFRTTIISYVNRYIVNTTHEKGVSKHTNNFEFEH